MLSIVAGVTMDLVLSFMHVGCCCAYIHVYTCVYSMKILNRGKTALGGGGGVYCSAPPPPALCRKIPDNMHMYKMYIHTNKLRHG